MMMEMNINANYSSNQTHEPCWSMNTIMSIAIGSKIANLHDQHVLTPMYGTGERDFFK
jgi:hypothetical protein